MSKKNKDKYNRFRSKTVAFRVSPDEWNHLEQLVNLSGLTKQDYIIKRLENREVHVHGNSRVYKAFEETLVKVIESLQKINVGDEKLTYELLEVIKVVATTLNDFKEN